MIFAKNALDGHFFQFNPGQFTGGETSPGFMFIVAALMSMYGEEIFPVLMKTISIFTFYGIGFFTYRLTRILDLSYPFPQVAGIVALLLPGTAYNGMLGTENGLFAAAILWLTCELLKRGWLTTPGRFSNTEEVVIGICLGALCLIRPEAAPYAGIMYGYRLVITSRDPRTCMMALSRGIFAFLGFVFIAGTFICFYRVYTGMMPYSAGVSRSILSRMDNCIYWGAVAINLKFLKRLIYYCSLSFPALFAIVLLVRKKIEGDTAKMTGLFLAIFGTFFILYSTMLPSVHLARYTIFLWPFLIVAGLVALAWLWENFPRQPYFLVGVVRRSVFFSGLIMLFLVAIVSETYFRHDQVTEYYRAVLSAPYRRNLLSDRLFEEFGSPAELPINLALQEVQIRYWLDNRFVVYSLDGIVDNTLTDYIHDGYYDHISYFLDREIDYFVPTRNYNKDKTAWSLAKLHDVEAGNAITKAGVELVKLPNGWVKINDDG